MQTDPDHCESGSISVGVNGVCGVVMPVEGALDPPFGLAGAFGSFVSKTIVIGPCGPNAVVSSARRLVDEIECPCVARR